MEEALLIEGAVAKRRREFTAGRNFARQALAELGVPVTPILAHDRRPLWPAGTLGSITHTHGRCAAAVARAEDFVGIGLDVEERGVVTEELQRYILSEAERDWLRSLPTASQTDWATLTFSAKEAFYKSLAELGVGFVEFHDINIGFHEGGTFDVAIVSEALAAKLRSFEIRGRCVTEADWIWTGVTLRRKT